MEDRRKRERWREREREGGEAGEGRGRGREIDCLYHHYEVKSDPCTAYYIVYTVLLHVCVE